MRTIKQMRELADVATGRVHVANDGSVKWAMIADGCGTDVLTLLDVLEKMAEALETVVASSLGSHQHFDYTQRHGAGCEMCVEQLAVKSECRTTLAAWRKLKGEGDEGPDAQ